jgi:aminoglycoside phosphotransferase (APT) family kinase protein
MPDQTSAITELLRTIFPAAARLAVERVAESHSTDVYRVWRDGRVLYFRVLPEREASFAPEVYVHHTLRARGLHVPEVIYFEHYNSRLQRSIMLTTEIPGRAIGYGPRASEVHGIVRQCGRELAMLNTVAVRGFGWIGRHDPRVDHLSAEHATYRAWLLPDIAAPLTTLVRENVLAARDAQAVRAAIDEAIALFGAEPAYLAHGDFDATHIYHQDGHYTGIIDFGEIRGTNQLYDLGHFQIAHADLLPGLLEGYAEIITLPRDYMRRILLTGLLIAVRRLGRWVARSATIYPPDLQAIERTLQALEHR